MLLLGKRIVHGRALIDPGSTGDFINSKFTSLHSLSLTPRSHPMTCTAFDGSPSVGGPVTHQWHGRLAMSAVEDQLFESPVSLNVSLLGDYDLILGMPWLRAHSGWVGAAGPSLLLLGPSSPSASFSIAVVDAMVAASTASQVPITSPSSSLPSHLSHFSDVFVPRPAGSLPPDRPGFDCKIVLKPDTLPPYSNPYLLLKEEETKLRLYLDDQLARGHVRPSSSPAAAPIFFVKSPGKKNRPCVDYRALNSLTV